MKDMCCSQSCIIWSIWKLLWATPTLQHINRATRARPWWWHKRKRKNWMSAFTFSRHKKFVQSFVSVTYFTRSEKKNTEYFHWIWMLRKKKSDNSTSQSRELSLHANISLECDTSSFSTFISSVAPSFCSFRRRKSKFENNYKSLNDWA